MIDTYFRELYPTSQSKVKMLNTHNSIWKFNKQKSFKRNNVLFLKSQENKKQKRKYVNK